MDSAKRASSLEDYWARSLRVAHFRLLRPSKISAEGRHSARFCMSGWVMSVPYPFHSQMAKVELRGSVNRRVANVSIDTGEAV